MAVQRRLTEIEARVNPLVGSTKEQVILELGVPTRMETVGAIEVFRYYRSYGSRSKVFLAPGDYLATGGGRTWEAYDIVNIYFKNGIMVKWDCFVQR